MLHSHHSLGSFASSVMAENKTLKQSISVGCLQSLRNEESEAARKHYLIITWNFLFLLGFISLKISLIPSHHPILLFSLLAVLYLSNIWQAAHFDWSILCFCSFSPKCSLLSSMNSWLLFFEIQSMKITKAKEFTKSYFPPSLTSYKEPIPPNLITVVPRAPYSLIKLIQFFWGLWINLCFLY